ncbi:molybdopterin-dependent oxidoreductase [Bacillus licheniformis]|nr:molybdopterin-dependent oxidoreductase [Bacillus licheniformis]
MPARDHGPMDEKGGGAIKGNTAFWPIIQSIAAPRFIKGRTPRVINMNQLGKALLETEPPIRSLFVYSSNPAVVAPEANKVRKGLEREDLFTVVHDLFLTETARYADIVLPASSAFEIRISIHHIGTIMRRFRSL